MTFMNTNTDHAFTCILTFNVLCKEKKPNIDKQRNKGT